MPSPSQIFTPLIRSIISEKDRYSFLRTLSKSFFENIPADELSVVLIDESSNLNRIWCACHRAGEIDINHDQTPVESNTGYYKKIFLQAEIFQKKANEPVVQWPIFLNTNYPAIAGLPVMSSDSVMGAVNAGRRNDFTDPELQLLQTYADLLSLSLLFYKTKNDYDSVNGRLNQIETDQAQLRERIGQADEIIDTGKSIMKQFNDWLTVLNNEGHQIPESTLQSLLAICGSMGQALSLLKPVSEFNEKLGLIDIKKFVDELKENLRLDIQQENLRGNSSGYLIEANYDAVLQSFINIFNQLKKTGSPVIGVTVQNERAHFLVTSGQNLPYYLMQQDGQSSTIPVQNPAIHIEMIKLRLLNAQVNFKNNGHVLDFDFVFPVVPNPTAVSDIESAAPVQQNDAVLKQILIVDDDDALRELLADILGSRGYHVTASSDGLRALELIHRENFSLVISDLEMPKINGVELAKRIKEIKSELPVAIITGWGNDLKEHSPYFDYVLPKPFNLSEVLQMVENCLTINTTDPS